MQGSIIAWTDNTFNPWMGCTKVSPGCKNCYAETLTTNRMGLHLWGEHAARQVTSAANWRKPITWNVQAKRDKVRLKTFCASLCDVFEDHPVARWERPRLFDLIRATPYLDWQLLTKRADNIAPSLPPDWGNGWPNVWLGVSIESNDYVGRADTLREVPAVVRFISYEPALGPLTDLGLSGIDWLIYGGESGPKYRAHDLTWPRAMRDRCRSEGVAYFFKQSSAIRTEMGTTLDGETIHEMPTPRAVGLSHQASAA